MPDFSLTRWTSAALGIAIGILLASPPAHAAPPRKKPAPQPVVAPIVAPPVAVQPVAPPPVVVAPKPYVEERPEEKAHSVNLSAMGAMYGDYGLNYQWMSTTGHALVVEGTFAYSNDKESGTTTGYGAQVGYRWFTRGLQNSWFLGMMAGYDIGTTTFTSSGGSDGAAVSVTRTYSLPSARWRATGTIGRRWVFGPGFNITARLGIGPGKRVYARGGDPEAASEAAGIEALVNFLPVSLDGETSIGWIF